MIKRSLDEPGVGHLGNVLSTGPVIRYSARLAVRAAVILPIFAARESVFADRSSHPRKTRLQITAARFRVAKRNLYLCGRGTNASAIFKTD